MRPPQQLRRLFWLALLGMLSACVGADLSTQSDEGSPGESDDASVVTSSTAVPRTTGVPTMRPTPADELGIVLDASGRPFDNYRGPDGTTTEQRLLARLQVGDEPLEVVDGDALYQPLLVTIEETESVDFRSVTELDLRIVWQQRPVSAATEEKREDEGPRFHPIGNAADSDREESILGVLVSAPGATVTRWGPFEPAYDSNDGLGAVIGRAALQWADENLEFGEPLLADELPGDRPYQLVDLDGEPGFDLFLFDNGSGSGAQALAEGFNSDDELVAIMLWHPRYPWRLAVPDGSPPPDIVEREEELIDCIEGRRLIDRWGRCT